jgi:hypothetical protein
VILVKNVTRRKTELSSVTCLIIFSRDFCGVCGQQCSMFSVKKNIPDICLTSNLQRWRFHLKKNNWQSGRIEQNEHDSRKYFWLSKCFCHKSEKSWNVFCFKALCSTVVRSIYHVGVHIWTFAEKFTTTFEMVNSSYESSKYFWLSNFFSKESRKSWIHFWFKRFALLSCEVYTKSESIYGLSQEN